MRHLKEFNTGERSIERVSELQAINFGQVFPSLNIMIMGSRKPPLPVPLDGVGVIPCKKDVPYFFSPGVRLLCKRSHWAELPPSLSSLTFLLFLASILFKSSWVIHLTLHGSVLKSFTGANLSTRFCIFH